MSMTGLEAFDSTIQKTNLWLGDIMIQMGTTDKHQAYLALRAVLQTLRDRLTIDEAAELGAQLPLLVRGLFFEGWKPAHKPEKSLRHKQDFLSRVHSYFNNDPSLDPEQVVTSVFAILEIRISSGEIADIRGMMPQELRDLWPEMVTIPAK